MKLGYARISTSDQDASMQIEALISVGVDPKRIFTDELSGAREAKERPGMKALMDYAREDDDVYFWRLDRIGRSVIDVLNTVNEFTSRGVRLQRCPKIRIPFSPPSPMASFPSTSCCMETTKRSIRKCPASRGSALPIPR